MTYLLHFVVACAGLWPIVLGTTYALHLLSRAQPRPCDWENERITPQSHGEVSTKHLAREAAPSICN